MSIAADAIEQLERAAGIYDRLGEPLSAGRCRQLARAADQRPELAGEALGPITRLLAALDQAEAEIAEFDRLNEPET